MIRNNHTDTHLSHTRLPTAGVWGWATAAVAAFALCPNLCLAGHPFLTDDPATVEVGALEGAASLLGRECAAHGLDLAAGLSLHSGLAENLGVGASLGGQILPRRAWAADLDDPVFDLKWRLQRGVALRLDYAPHLASGEGHDLGLVLAAEREWSGLVLLTNAAVYARSLFAGATEWAGFFSSAVQASVADGLVAGLEGVAFAGPRGLEVASALAAVAWETSPGAAVSFGVGPTWQSGEPVLWGATLGLTATFSFLGGK